MERRCSFPEKVRSRAQRSFPSSKIDVDDLGEDMQLFREVGFEVQNNIGETLFVPQQDENRDAYLSPGFKIAVDEPEEETRFLT